MHIARIAPLFMIFAFPLMVGCTSTGGAQALDTATPEGSFQLAERLGKDERYEESIAQFTQVKNKHPYSKLATESELRIADIHFKREEFIEAAAAYQTFKEMHPSHPQIDFVTFRLGLSYFNQLPSTIDRDLAVADRAMLYFDEVVNSFPHSQYIDQARDNKTKALKMLAEKELYVGHFYFIRERFESALGRYEDCLDKYPGIGYDAQALYGASVSAFKIKEMTKARNYYEKLQADFSSSTEAEKARKEIGNAI